MSVRFGIAQPTGRLGQRPRTPKAIAPRGIRYRNQLRSCQTSARARPLKDPAIHAIAVHPETPRMLTDPAEWSRIPGQNRTRATDTRKASPGATARHPKHSRKVAQFTVPHPP